MCLKEHPTLPFFVEKCGIVGVHRHNAGAVGTPGAGGGQAGRVLSPAAEACLSGLQDAGVGLGRDGGGPTCAPGRVRHEQDGEREVAVGLETLN